MKEESIVLVATGEIEPGLLENLRGNLKKIFNKEISINRPMEIPEHTYNPRRKQYHSTGILELIIKKGKTTVHDKTLAIIDRDLYVPELNFVFGEASRQAALISITRLREEYYGAPQDKAVFYKRVLTEAVHELGHVYGLRHCNNPHCVMFFSNSLIDTDRKGFEFCPICKERLLEKK